MLPLPSSAFSSFQNLGNCIHYIYGNLPEVIKGCIITFFGITVLFGIAKMIKG